nr:GMC family oxidoreductase N-terminal domain-containing protein [Pseudoruegeria aquimaris]
MTAEMEFDYVIVGGGSGGATLAARLSEDRKVSVCLLEAGGDGKDMLIRLPIGAALMVPGHPVPMNNWAFETIPQEELAARRGYQPRGKALGGSSAINAMIYTRGNPKDYDHWARLGCTGWAWEDVLPYFRKSEDNSRGADDYHGEGGPLQVTDPQSPRPISRDFVAAAEAVGIPANGDFNGPVQEGAGLFQLTQFHDRRRGERCSAAAAFLHPVMTRANLEVITHALGRRVLFDGRTACGVEFSRRGQIRRVKARREVILCAGALQSPQLLMLSGIGNAHQLRAHGIDVVQNLPEVGLNLQDHIDTVLGYEVNTTNLFGIGLKGGARLLKALRRWRREGRGMAASNFAEAGAFLSVGDGAEGWPDVQMHFVVGRLINHARTIRPGYGVTLHTCLLRPKSRGWVRLGTADPSDAPMIDPGFLEAGEDADLLLAAVKRGREIMAAPPMAQHVIKDHDCAHVTSDADLMAVLREKSDTIYHPVGTCRMGGDDASVLDPQLRVRGVEGLRVVDASAMPQIVSGNTNAPVIMMAEKAADMIRQARLGG